MKQLLSGTSALLLILLKFFFTGLCKVINVRIGHKVTFFHCIIANDRYTRQSLNEDCLYTISSVLIKKTGLFFKNRNIPIKALWEYL